MPQDVDARVKPGHDESASVVVSIFKQPILRPSLRGANGSRECAPMTGSATKQSILFLRGEMDCFAALAMTGSVAALLASGKIQSAN
jgi:hypothetical protein